MGSIGACNSRFHQDGSCPEIMYGGGAIKQCVRMFKYREKCV